ncbi:hypothetical protein [Scytonema sp. PRP1]|uniref:hypothetical protein n=1 Tax=Scytonema sp. PRP1 TaxID=3120513 RepID=UPI002FD5E23A
MTSLASQASLMGESSEDTVGEIFLNAENPCAVVETRQRKLPKITPPMNSPTVSAKLSPATTQWLKPFLQELQRISY